MNFGDLIPILYATGAFVVGFLSGLRFVSTRNNYLNKQAKERIEQIESDQVEQAKVISEKIQKAIDDNDLDAVADLTSKLLSNYPMP